MSQNVGCYVGFGFEWDCHVSNDILKSFFNNHKDVLDKCAGANAVRFVLSDNFKAEEFEDCFGVDADYGYSGNYVMNLVANIISEETGIRISAVNHDGENDTIMFEPPYPWELTEAERKLTSGDTLRNILKKYRDELGITGEIGTQYVEWWG